MAYRGFTTLQAPAEPALAFFTSHTKTDSDIAALNNMEQNGSHFVSALAKAGIYADSQNWARMKDAFGDIIDRFRPANYDNPRVADAAAAAVE